MDQAFDIRFSSFEAFEWPATVFEPGNRTPPLSFSKNQDGTVSRFWSSGCVAYKFDARGDFQSAQ